MKRKSVCVYMSTYNGDTYLRQQIDSILNQKDVRVILCIRDDGSTDTTVAIISEYIEKGENIKLIQGSNIGFMKSFATVSHVPINADYYAFADQDDVWMLDKLMHAIEEIEKIQGPVLYGGNIYITDENMENRRKLYNLDYSYKSDIIRNGFALGYNTYACSMVWNQKLQRLIFRYFPNNMLSHDVYLSILAGAVGTIIVDYEPYILHRMHDSNTAGIENNIMKRVKKGYKLYWGKNRRHISNTVEEIISEYRTEIFETTESEGRRLLLLVGLYKYSISNKIQLLRAPFVQRIKGTRAVWMKMLIAFGKL